MGIPFGWEGGILTPSFLTGDENEFQSNIDSSTHETHGQLGLQHQRCLLSTQLRSRGIQSMESIIVDNRYQSIFNNYSPKWRWLAVDIYRAVKRRGNRGKYQPLATDNEVNSCFSLY